MGFGNTLVDAASYATALDHLRLHTETVHIKITADTAVEASKQDRDLTFFLKICANKCFQTESLLNVFFSCGFARKYYAKTVLHCTFC